MRNFLFVYRWFPPKYLSGDKYRIVIKKKRGCYWFTLGFGVIDIDSKKYTEYDVTSRPIENNYLKVKELI